MKALEWSQNSSHYKYMGIYLDAKVQLTPQSEVWTGQVSNPSENLWLYLLPATMKKSQSKIEALEWLQHYSFIFQMLKGS